MELYIDPIATTGRAVLAFCLHEQMPIRIQRVALMKGEQHLPQFARLNPNRLVPVLVDDGFVLTEASAILRYLARKSASALYPSDLRGQARVDELLAWFDSNFYRDFAFGHVYPQLLPQHRLATDDATRALVAHAFGRCAHWLQVLDRHWLGDEGYYLLGQTPTIADFFGASILSVGEMVNFELNPYRNVQRWYRAVGELGAWRSANVEFAQFVEAIRSMHPATPRPTADAEAA
jgi:glutathione S-transferase